MKKYYGSFTMPRYIGYTTKKHFIEEVSKQMRYSEHYILERMSETENVLEIEEMKKQPGKVFISYFMG